MILLLFSSPSFFLSLSLPCVNLFMHSIRFSHSRRDTLLSWYTTFSCTSRCVINWTACACVIFFSLLFSSLPVSRVRVASITSCYYTATGMIIDGWMVAHKNASLFALAHTVSARSSVTLYTRSLAGSSPLISDHKSHPSLHFFSSLPRRFHLLIKLYFWLTDFSLSLPLFLPLTPRDSVLSTVFVSVIQYGDSWFNVSQGKWDTPQRIHRHREMMRVSSHLINQNCLRWWSVHHCQRLLHLLIQTQYRFAPTNRLPVWAKANYDYNCVVCAIAFVFRWEALCIEKTGKERKRERKNLLHHSNSSSIGLVVVHLFYTFVSPFIHTQLGLLSSSASRVSWWSIFILLFSFPLFICSNLIYTPAVWSLDSHRGESVRLITG